MRIYQSPLVKDRIFRLRISFIGLAFLLIILSSAIQRNYNPAKWMTYRDFDVPGEVNFINYLSPGVPDSSTGKKYDFKHKHISLLLIILFLFFPFMFFIRVIFDLDFKFGVYRYFTQWVAFVVARLGIFRVTGVCPVKRTGLGVFPYMNCQSCELATGACPLGTFQMSLLNRQIPFLLIGQIILVGILSGRAVCGWLCPYGFLSDIFNKLPGKRIKLNLKWSYIKYPFLAIFLISSISYFFKDKSDILFYCSFLCPVGFYYGVLEYALTTGLKGMIKDFPFLHYMLIYHFFIGALVIIGSIKLGGRFFCKYFCPLGTVYGLFAKISVFNIRLNSNKCNGCGNCTKVCPMNISILNQGFVSKSNCILCGRCRRVCPVKKVEYCVSLFGDKTVISGAKAKTVTNKKGGKDKKILRINKAG